MKIFQHVPIQFEELEATSTPTGRIYQTPDGKLYPSVTTVLAQHGKQAITEWRQRVGEEEANKISRQSATRGTKFHNMAEKYLRNELHQEKFSLLDREIFELAKPELHNIDNIRALEVPLYSHHLRLAGRVDCIGEYKGKLSIIDFKTARREKEESYIQHYYMQAAAYAIMFEERTNIPINNLTIIIAVDDGFVQVFQSKRDKHVEGLLYYRDMFEVYK
jgi:ATP-dependent exoDNAse (exonuclease V) beta subunit